MLHTWMPDNTIKLRFRDLFDDDEVAVITHDFNAKTLRLGPGYSILDENGDPLGAGGPGGGISGSGVANQIAYWTDTDEIGGSAGFTFDPTTGLALSLTSATFISAIAPTATLTPISDGNESTYGIYSLAFLDGAFNSSGAVGISAIAELDGAGDTDALIGGAFLAIAAGAGLVADLIGVSADAQIIGGNATNAYGIKIGDIAGATNNYAIRTGAGDIRFGALAGSGTRYVYVDDDGDLVAGAAV